MMKITHCLLFTIFSGISQFSFALPAQEQTIEEFFKITDLKKMTLDSLDDNNLKILGKTKEGFWKQLEPKVRDIYKDVLTEEEILSSIQFYKTKEGQALLKKTPELIKRSTQATMEIIFDQDSLGLYSKEAIEE